jgi:phosphoribosylaminoimidazole-succinocarboxamide synthase
LRKCKIILADTKFEFGVSKNGDLILMDELLTSDSSRFWPSESYQEGISPPSLDKQFIRDFVKSISWNDTMPAPELPDDIVMKTSEKYEDLRKILMD